MMQIFDKLIKEIANKEFSKKEHIDSLESFIISISQRLLDESFHPSKALRNLLDKYLRRAKYPMEVAIVGQFSSGKSTFLNALLSKDILPTGITPVTSKVNFINYGDDYKLKITFKSGATEFHGIEHLARFTDQRETIEDIKYLSLYAPVEMLKEISFVDTPGLNSQSKFDTDTTNTILRDVDGIIWLGLIDAVAKKSELDTLDKYLPNYSNKSICLLNQKDRLEPDQVDTALEYAKENYDGYFSKIIAISARKALESRVHQKENIIFCEKKRFVSELEENILSGDMEIDEDFISGKLSVHHENINKIKEKDFTHHLEDLENSNILEVLEFIDNILRPKAKEAKMFAIKKDLNSLCDILKNEYSLIGKSYLDLYEIIQSNHKNLDNKISELDSEISRQVELLGVKINENINLNVSQIYASVKPVKRYLIKEKKSFLSSTYIKEEYTSYALEPSTDTSYNISESFEYLESSLEFAIDEMKKILNSFEKDMILWQVKNKKLSKLREVASDIEFYNIRYFAAELYETILKDFTIEFDEYVKKLQNKVLKVSIKNRFELAYEKTITQIFFQITNMQNSYEKNPDSSVINSIDESEILLFFKENLDFNYLKREFQKDDSFIKASLLEYSKNTLILTDKVLIKMQKLSDNISEKINNLDEIKDDVGF